MTNWLHDFAYHVQLGWLVFVMAGATAVMIAVITVGTLAVKAATDNPLKNLRIE